MKRSAPNRLVLKVLSVLGVLALVSYAGPAAAKTFYVDAVGGSGGQNYTAGCSGDVLAGFRVRQGSAVDQVALYCATPRKGGFLDPPRLLPATGAGGTGGKAYNAVCPTNFALVGLVVTVYSTDVNNFSVLCRDVGNGNLWTINVPYEPSDGVGAEPRVVHCGTGNLAVGIFGRADTIVHSIGLQCTEDPFSAPPPPPPSPQPTTPPPPAPDKPALPVTNNPPPLDVTNGDGGGADGGGGGGASAATDTTIYDQPGGNDTAYLQAGDPVTIVSCDGDGWCKISKPQKGYVWGDDLNN